MLTNQIYLQVSEHGINIILLSVRFILLNTCYQNQTILVLRASLNFVCWGVNILLTEILFFGDLPGDKKRLVSGYCIRCFVEYLDLLISFYHQFFF